MKIGIQRQTMETQDFHPSIGKRSILNGSLAKDTQIKIQRWQLEEHIIHSWQSKSVASTFTMFLPITMFCDKQKRKMIADSGIGDSVTFLRVLQFLGFPGRVTRPGFYQGKHCLVREETNENKRITLPPPHDFHSKPNII